MPARRLRIPKDLEILCQTTRIASVEVFLNKCDMPISKAQSEPITIKNNA